MNLTVDYTKAIHPECGKEVQTYKDIVITPFYTEEFCDELVEMSEFYKKKFSASMHYIKNYTRKFGDSPWDSLYFSRISHFLFEDFCNHYKKYIFPVIEKQSNFSSQNFFFISCILNNYKKSFIVKRLFNLTFSSSRASNPPSCLSTIDKTSSTR